MALDPRADPGVADAGRDTILVVDDNPESLHFLIETIERAGMTALIATSGDDALELLHHVIPDLILIDGVMPGRDGFETTRAIKRDARLAAVPVIFMTGLTETEHAVRGLAAGGIDYVRKPVDVEELLARMAVHLHNARVSAGGRAALDATGRHLMAVDRDGALLWATPHVEQLLAAAQAAGEGEDLSAALSPTLGAATARLAAPAERTGSLIKLEVGGVPVELVLVAHLRAGETLLRLNWQREGAEIEALRERYGLTQREAEVLLWISYGKPNRAISEILGISPRTVNKHLEQVFQKLGVETRAAAAAFAVRTLN
ncbi:DNA-binding response regulator [Novosphingobium sp. FKTRR1]|uniref:response regulator transcription factor n=1 Tax=Novosphingobium sp. FKTRR1 TaxID=2879118 RepID=UPI001CEFC3A4|nr:DNA-binding response regulator [Novosphingobium sp. FKTRR1]